jgi:hypothetical protein
VPDESAINTAGLFVTYCASKTRFDKARAWCFEEEEDGWKALGHVVEKTGE